MGAPFLGPGGGGLPPAILQLIDSDSAVRSAINAIANSSPSGADHFQYIFNGIGADVTIAATAEPATPIISSGIFLPGPPPGGSATWLVIAVAIVTLASPAAESVAITFGPNGGLATEAVAFLTAVSTGPQSTLTLPLVHQVGVPSGGANHSLDLAGISSVGTAVAKRYGLSGTGDYATAVMAIAMLQSGSLA